MLTIAIILSALSLAASVAAIFLLARLTTMTDELNKDLDRESLELRHQAEQIPVLKQQIETVFASQKDDMGKISSEIKELTEQNHRQQLEMQTSLSRTLNDIRDRNDASAKESRETLEKNLEQIRMTVDEKLTKTLSTRLDSSFKTVSEQLENVYKSLGEMKELSGSVTENVTGLSKILSNVKSRGTWGEAQLKNILDDIIPTLYDSNVSTNPHTTERVEFAVKIPTGTGSDYIYLPIDSKFPMEDYARLVSAVDNGNIEAANEARKDLKNHVAIQAHKITMYIHEPETTSFAIMYLATEGLYAEIAGDEALVAKIRSNDSVMIAGPSTIAALLNSLAMGFRTVAINKKAEEVWKVLGEAKGQYSKFEDLLGKAQKKIEEAGGILENAQKKNSLIQKKLKNVEAIETPEGADDNPELENTDII